MSLKIGFICLFLASSAFAAPRDSSKVSVTLLAGPADIDSLTYIDTQIREAYDKIPEYVDIHYVPLGLINSTKNPENDSITWHCPEGEIECELDKINSCLIKRETKQLVEQFWQCEIIILGTWTSPDPFTLDDLEDLLKKCSSVYPIDTDKLNKCRKSEESTQYLIEHEKFLKENGINKLPAVWFNDKYDKDLDAAAQKDFLSTVCGLLEPKPSGCNK